MQRFSPRRVHRLGHRHPSVFDGIYILKEACKIRLVQTARADTRMLDQPEIVQTKFPPLPVRTIGRTADRNPAPRQAVRTALLRTPAPSVCRCPVFATLQEQQRRIGWARIVRCRAARVGWKKFAANGWCRDFNADLTAMIGPVTDRQVSSAGRRRSPFSVRWGLRRPTRRRSLRLALFPKPVAGSGTTRRLKLGRFLTVRSQMRISGKLTFSQASGRVSSR